MKKTIVVGCDNAACTLKNEMIKKLTSEGYSVEDVGVADSSDKTIYPLIAERVATKMIESNYEKEGMLFCGTGIGMAMTANKFPGIFAVVCHDSFSAERGRLSNNGNLLCMGERVIGVELAKKVMMEWLSNTYKPGTSSEEKVLAMRAIDKKNVKI